MKRIYIASPISIGDQFRNVRDAIDVAQDLLKLGFAPFVPQLGCFWHMVHANDYETWMTYDFTWVRACDALLRLPGESNGADREVDFARSLGISVFFTTQELVEHFLNRGK